MASKPLRPCRHPGCAVLTRDGWCPAHKPKPAARGESAAWHSWYSLPVWTRQLRPAQFLREPFCRVCADQGFRTYATVVDHVQPFRGDWALFTDPANHQSLCKYHHDQKTAREQAEERRKSNEEKAAENSTIFGREATSARPQRRVSAPMPLRPGSGGRPVPTGPPPAPRKF